MWVISNFSKAAYASKLEATVCCSSSRTSGLVFSMYSIGGIAPTLAVFFSIAAFRRWNPAHFHLSQFHTLFRPLTAGPPRSV